MCPRAPGPPRFPSGSPRCWGKTRLSEARGKLILTMTIRPSLLCIIDMKTQCFKLHLQLWVPEHVAEDSSSVERSRSGRRGGMWPHSQTRTRVCVRTGRRTWPAGAELRPVPHACVQTASPPKQQALASHGSEPGGWGSGAAPGENAPGLRQPPSLCVLTCGGRWGDRDTERERALGTSPLAPSAPRLTASHGG